MAEPITLTVSPELWVSNILTSTKMSAQAERQRERWLAVDAKAWEVPGEETCSLFDDDLFEEFVAAFAASFNQAQIDAIRKVLDSMNVFWAGKPDFPDAEQVLDDPAWEEVRQGARAFTAAFDGKWPDAAIPREDILEMQRVQQQAYADRNERLSRERTKT